jgi:hypothetical protein
MNKGTLLKYENIKLVDSHVHFNWFEVDKNEFGTVIMCPDGCKRLLQKNGKVAYYNKEKDLWEEL